MPVLYRGRRIASRETRRRELDTFFARAAYVWVILVALFMVLVWIGDRPRLQYRAITVDGARSTDLNALHAAVGEVLQDRLLGVIRRDNPVYLNTRALTDRIMHLNNRIIAVTVSSDYDGMLRIALTERTPTRIWCAKVPEVLGGYGSCYYVDQEGKIFDTAAAISGGLYERYITNATGTVNEPPIFQYILPSELYARVQLFIAALQTAQISVVEIREEEGGDFLFHTDQSQDIRWNISVAPEIAVRNLRLVQDSIQKTATATPRIIDLRFGNKIFYQ